MTVLNLREDRQYSLAWTDFRPSGMGIDRNFDTVTIAGNESLHDYTAAAETGWSLGAVPGQYNTRSETHYSRRI
jgi:hypothetical protein